MGGPVLSLAVEHDIRIIFGKLLKEKNEFSMAGPRHKCCLEEQGLNGLFILSSSLLHACSYDMASKFFICMYLLFLLLLLCSC